MVIKCLHEKTLYCNEQTGYTIASYKTDNSQSIPTAARRRLRCTRVAFTAVGNRLPTATGVEVELSGKWADSGKYGMQLSVEDSIVVRPKTIDGIVAYLSSDLIRGIGTKTATAIVRRFGVQTLNIFDNEPRRLLEVSGITEKKLETILNGYRESVGLRDIMTALAPYSVTPKKAEKIFAAYGVQSVEIVKANPYTLCDIAGFGFATVDEIARKNGITYDDPGRIAQGIIYTLEKAQQSGHLFLHTNELCKSSAMLLSIGAEIVPHQVLNLVLNEQLCEDKGQIYLTKNFIAERETAKLAKAMIGTVRVIGDLDKIISQAETDCGITLAIMQRNAVKMAITNNISIITGGPGTGKTTVIKVILAVYKKIIGGSVAFAAPTGKASRRLSESVGACAATLHSTLGLREDSYETHNTVTADFLVVDEVSMVDMALAHLLVKSLKPKTKLLLVGDHNQLPSVGAGNVLRELLQCGRMPFTKLNVVHRQAQTSRISLNAHAILENKGAGLMYGADFEFVEANSSVDAAKYVKNIYYGYIKRMKAEGVSLAHDEVQILSPMRIRGACGTNALNKDIQDALNPISDNKPEIAVGFRPFRLHDKVMQTKNRANISNGDIGSITSIEKYLNGAYEVQIDFGDGRNVTYGPDEMVSIDLAYAMTIHKSQGSEYPVVIIPILNEANIMLQRNLIYTAITRAKDRVIIVGQKEAFLRAIRKADMAKRNTVLGQLIAS